MTKKSKPKFLNKKRNAKAVTIIAMITVAMLALSALNIIDSSTQSKVIANQTASN